MKCKLAVILSVLVAVSTVGCGEDSRPEGNSFGGEWESYPDEDSTGEMVEGTEWVHEPEFGADRAREFLYKISTNRRVDVFVAPADNCQASAAYEQEIDVDRREFHLQDYSDYVDSGVGTPVCVHFTAHLASAGGSWHVEILAREP